MAKKKTRAQGAEKLVGQDACVKLRSILEKTEQKGRSMFFGGIDGGVRVEKGRQTKKKKECVLFGQGGSLVGACFHSGKNRVKEGAETSISTPYQKTLTAIKGTYWGVKRKEGERHPDRCENRAFTRKKTGGRGKMGLRDH